MARAGPDGWRTVTIRIPIDDDRQRRTLAGLLGRPIRPGAAATQVILGDLDTVLAQPGDGWDLVTTVEALHGALPDRAATARARRKAIDAALVAARDAINEVTTDGDRREVSGADGWLERWLDDLDQGVAARLHGRGQLDLVATAARILASLPADGIPLPALAATTTGDTKALGRTTLAGLVLRGLAIRLDEPVPASAAERRALWEAAGVVPDDLASQVLVLGLRAEGGLLARWLSDAAAHGVPFRVTLQQLTEHPLTAAPTTVFVCENPAVMRAAASQLGAGCAPLVCTEGRPSVAVTRLLAVLARGGCELRYHGDFDWPGVRIAATVLDLPDAGPWRYGTNDYHAGVERVAGPREPLRGVPAPTPWDAVLADAMADADVAVYEEDVLDILVNDLEQRSR